MKTAKKRKLKSLRRVERLRSITIHIIVGFVAFLTILPPLIILSGSFSDSQKIIDNGYRLWPQDFSFEAYRYVLKDLAQLLQSYKITIIVTGVGTMLGLSMTSMVAFALSRNAFKMRKLLGFYFFFTMIFHAGTVPYYILVVQTLGLKDTIWALIIPGLINPWFIFLLRAYFKSIPSDFYDAAKVDGAGEFTIFTRIAMPLAKPALATIGMFYVLGYWNDWFTPLLFIDSTQLTPLQYMLNRMLENVIFLQRNMQNLSFGELASLPTQSLRMAMAVLAAGPMTLVFLFFQRHFVKGLTLGGLKG